MTEKKFKEQTAEERYQGLLDRLNNLMTNWEMWASDLRTKATLADQSKSENPGLISGMYCQARMLTKCREQVQALTRIHNWANKNKATDPSMIEQIMRLAQETETNPPSTTFTTIE